MRFLGGQKGCSKETKKAQSKDIGRTKKNKKPSKYRNQLIEDFEQRESLTFLFNKIEFSAKLASSG